MATCALIAIMNDDRTISTIYVCSDGYLSWTGPKLLEFYNTPEMVSVLLESDRYQIQDYIDDRNKTDVLFEDARTYQSLDSFLEVGFAHKYIFMNGEWYYHNDNKLELLLDALNMLTNKSRNPKMTFNDKIRVSIRLIKRELYYLKDDLSRLWES